MESGDESPHSKIHGVRRLIAALDALDCGSVEGKAAAPPWKAVMNHRTPRSMECGD